jgi:hypothetical protein
MYRRLFTGYCFVALACISNTLLAQVPDQKVAVEVGELDLDTKEFESVNSGQAKAFVYVISREYFVLQWVNPVTGKNIGTPEYFEARGPGTDFKNRPNTVYFSDKNAVKVVPSGAPSGDLIYFTPRNWIAQKYGWKSVFYQLKTQ